MWKFLQRLVGDNSKRPRDAQTAPLNGDMRGAQSALHDSEEQFATLVSGVRDYAILLLDRHGIVTTWNLGAERIKGYRAEEIIGQHFSRFYPSEAVSTGWPDHELEIATETGRFEDEGWRVRKDGSKFWASVVITSLKDDAGELRGFLKITRDLTDRRQAEEKLRRSEERFRLLIEGVSDYAIFMLDPQGRVATWNAGAERFKGYRACEIVGQHFSRFYPKEAIVRGWPEEELRRATSDGRIEDEGWRVRKDGSLFWASVVITALHDESGALYGFAKVTRDLTDRRNAEMAARKLLQEEAARKAAQTAAEEIERQREQLHVTLSSIGDAVVVADQKGCVTFLNSAASTLTGWPLQEAVGQPLECVFRIVNERSRAPVDNPVAQVFRENRVVALANHTALLARDGREVPIEDSAAPIRSRNGDVVGAVLVFRDVTEARRARDARLYLAAIVESSDDAIIGQTLDGKIASWNRGAERLYGYKADEVIGKPLALLVPDDHQDELPEFTARIRCGEDIDHFETERIRKDGARVSVSLTISPVKNSEGRVIGASKIARDITARKEEDRRKNEFLALLAHELRNPLAPLRNGLEVMRLAGDDRTQAEQTRALMERQLEHLVRLVDDLLDVSRISQGKLQLRRERIAVADAVAHALDVCGPGLREYGQELSIQIPDEPIWIDADKTRIAQAVCNLINNAVKYGNPSRPIRLTVERDGRAVAIRVRDEGIGIPHDLQPHIFDMFMQVDRTIERSRGGLGVGLTIVKRLVEMHGGSVEVRSEGANMGSEFTLRLPIAASAGNGSPESPERTLCEEVAPRRRILVVDDNVDAADSLAMMLTMMGNEVRVAHDGAAGYDVASAFRPEIVLLDIGMPRLNGYETARRMREQPWGQDMMIAALTGWGQLEDRRKSREAGFDSHLDKPVEPAALNKLLENLPHAVI